MDNTTQIRQSPAVELPQIKVSIDVGLALQFAQFARVFPLRVGFEEADTDERMRYERHSANTSPIYDAVHLPPRYTVDNDDHEDVSEAVRACYVAFEVHEVDTADELPAPELTEIDQIVVEGMAYVAIRQANGDIFVNGATLQRDGVWHAGDSTHWYMSDAIRAAGEKSPESTYPPELH